MQDLRDKLLKAGVINKKQKRKGDHKAREAKKKHADLQQRKREAQEREAELAARAQAAKETRRKELERLREQQECEERARQLEMIIRDNHFPPAKGQSKFFFLDKNGKTIHYLETSEYVVDDLVQGYKAIVEFVENQEIRFGLVNRQIAERIEKIEESAIRFFNHQPPAEEELF